MSMNKKSDYIIDFTHASKSEEVLSYDLGDDFFTAEEGETHGGEMHLEVRILPLPSNLYELKCNYDGVVEVECDRCLAPLELDMEIQESMHIQLGDELNDENDETLILDAKEPKYDFSHIFYEFVALHLPLQRVHDIEDCDPNMVKYLVDTVPEEDSNKEEKPKENPIWAKLRDEIENKSTNN